MLVKERSEFQNYVDSTTHEWLETNGLGGWSASTLCGAHTRRYHGLLVAAVVPPTDRMVVLSKLDETIVINGERYELGVNNYGTAVHPEGYQYLMRFEKFYFPEFNYEAGGVKLKKTIAMIHGENTVVISYNIVDAPVAFELELLPLIAGRGYHSLSQANQKIDQHALFEGDIFQAKVYPSAPTLFIKIPNALYRPDPAWYYHFDYSIESYRGLDHQEDLFSHGKFVVRLKKGDSLQIVISTNHPGQHEGNDLLMLELTRRKNLLKDSPANKLQQQLILAADQFIVRRHLKTALEKAVDGATIIAGYHWFTDWGRDTMISLPGLCLSTGRFDDARKIISAFAASVSKGMLPNRFQDDGGEPEYNNVDGTLWYFIAIYKYLQATSDRAFVLNEILPVLKSIIDWHFKGTRYNIKVEEDGLLFAGEKGQQLTWMDARIGDWVVTPRMGKPVEIQALWYNALKIFSMLLDLNGQPEDASIVEISANRIKNTFLEKFWFEEGSYLYDVIDENGSSDKSLRPNQLFAISLPFALVEGNRAKSIMEVISKELYTPVGLRTLPRSDSRYTPVYGGDQWHRDSSYHQGTVWSWLLGPYLDALVKTESGDAELKNVVNNFCYHLEEGCLGSVSEIFDAEYPHHPRGCAAQAWGVAEVLRAMNEHGLSKS
jgi:predicted glycogen debranching enzyme